MSSIFSFTIIAPFFLLPPIAGLIFGIIAKVKGNKTSTATSGLVLSIIGTVLMIISILLINIVNNM